MDIPKFYMPPNGDDDSDCDSEDEYNTAKPQRARDEVRRITWLHSAKRLVEQNKACELFCPELGVFCPELCPNPDPIYLLEDSLLAPLDTEDIHPISSSVTQKTVETSINPENGTAVKAPMRYDEGKDKFLLTPSEKSDPSAQKNLSKEAEAQAKQKAEAAAAAKKKADEDQATKKEEASAAAKKKIEEAEAVAGKKAEEAAAAKKKADNERMRKEEEREAAAVAQKKAAEETAAAKKKVEEAADARKKADDDQAKKKKDVMRSALHG